MAREISLATPRRIHASSRCRPFHPVPSAVAAFRLLLLTGCRLSEIQFLRWEYVKDDCIELPDAKTGGRAVPLGPVARAVLADMPREDGNPWVIRGKLPGSHITDLQKPWRRIRARADLEDVRIDDLSHSFASRALALGEGLPIIGRLLGHRRVETTARYAHRARDSMRKSANASPSASRKISYVEVIAGYVIRSAGATERAKQHVLADGDE